MLILKVYSNNDFLGYLDIEKRDITRHMSGARIFNDEEIEEVKYIAKRFSDYKIVKLELKETGLKVDKNIYDGCGLISSEVISNGYGVYFCGNCGGSIWQI